MNNILPTLSHLISYTSIGIICYGAAMGLIKFVLNEFNRFGNSFSPAETVHI